MGVYQLVVVSGYMLYKDYDDCGCDDDYQLYYFVSGYFGYGVYGIFNILYGGVNLNLYVVGVFMLMVNQFFVN